MVPLVRRKVGGLWLIAGGGAFHIRHPSNLEQAGTLAVDDVEDQDKGVATIMATGDIIIALCTRIRIFGGGEGGAEILISHKSSCSSSSKPAAGLRLIIPVRAMRSRS